MTGLRDRVVRTAGTRGERTLYELSPEPRKYGTPAASAG